MAVFVLPMLDLYPFTNMDERNLRDIRSDLDDLGYGFFVFGAKS